MKKMTLCAMALCALSMAACADRMNKSASTTGNDMTGPAPAPMAASAPMPAPSSAQAGVGVVQAIDQLQRQDVGVGMLGAAAAGGMPTDKVYRITMRLDDGSTQVVVVESEPSYKIGDRVRYSNSTVQFY
ncbi:hypothetical protein GTP45_01800 [Pseudoduganella sp. FT55W]|uniref:Lipoprotein n=1 Tax=Duganella rivi TaxID=2666083 RepID=A0A7X4GLE1_9BURK|nr:hypothetical protein [Duganella rivi]MYM65568.1 hypothetical protein [Duganella rivi]